MQYPMFPEPTAAGSDPRYRANYDLPRSCETMSEFDLMRLMMIFEPVIIRIESIGNAIPLSVRREMERDFKEKYFNSKKTA